MKQLEIQLECMLVSFYIYKTIFFVFILLNIIVSPTHLIKLGFLDQDIVTSQYEINYLMRMALQKVAVLPFTYIMDKYRFTLFRNQINPKTELNKKWWEMRIQYSGIMPPIIRYDPENFDPGAKYHVATNSPYAIY